MSNTPYQARVEHHWYAGVGGHGDILAEGPIAR